MRAKRNKLKTEYYDRFHRDQEAKRFYQSPEWRAARAMKLKRSPLCESCTQAGRSTPAQMVHHLVPVRDGVRKLDFDFLVSLCHACHSAVEGEVDRERR
jgi:5-methylcytosine-specific restriction protein A